MIRINLVPREILERRKYERFYPWVAIFAVVVFALVFLVWAFLGLQVASRNRALQQEQQSAQQLQTQAEAFAIFEQKQQELDARKETVDLALKGRARWGRVATEVSLVLPSEVWLNTFTGLQEVAEAPFDEAGTYVGYPSSLTLSSQTPDAASNDMSEGYKSVAKTLVRLNDLETLNDVWLVDSVVSEYPDGAVDVTPVTTLIFNASSGVVIPGVQVSGSSTSGSSAVPAPPSTPGQ